MLNRVDMSASCQLATDKLQAVLINVLIISILNTKVSHGSVATRLRCDVIFSNRFVTLSQPSLLVKEFFKIGYHSA